MICGILIETHKGMFLMKYIVKRIDEDPDYGCEERIEGVPVMAIVTLIDEDGENIETRQPDQLLYERGINEGDVVFLDVSQELRKGEYNGRIFN